MKNKDLGVLAAHANLLCRVENIPFKISRRAKELHKLAEGIILKLKEIAELGAEKKASEEEIEDERLEYLEKEVEGQIDVCQLAWFDEIPNVSIPYLTDSKETENVSSHACIHFLIEKGWIV